MSLLRRSWLPCTRRSAASPQIGLESIPRGGTPMAPSKNFLHGMIARWRGRPTPRRPIKSTLSFDDLEGRVVLSSLGGGFGGGAGGPSIQPGGGGGGRRGLGAPGGGGGCQGGGAAGTSSLLSQ